MSIEKSTAKQPIALSLVRAGASVVLAARREGEKLPMMGFVSWFAIYQHTFEMLCPSYCAVDVRVGKSVEEVDEKGRRD